MDQTIIWARLKASAIAGLNRVPFETEGNESGLPAERLLQQAVKSHWQLKAGLIPQPAETALSLSPADERDYLPPVALHQLKRLLKGRNAFAMAELLQLCVQHQRIIPAAFVPALLNWGNKSSLAQQLILDAAGNRAQWLAPLRSEWKKYLVPSQEDWNKGKKEDRVRWLIYQRNHAPDKARAALLPLIERGELFPLLLSTLGLNLSEADLPLLDQLRKYKRKEMRQTAVRLLSRLPYPAHQEILQTLLTAVIQFNDLTASRLTDEQFQQVRKLDLGKLPVSKLANGEKTRALSQLITAVDLNWWETQGTLSPQQCAEVLRSTNDKLWLYTAFLFAAAHQQNHAWASALLPLLFEQKDLQALVQVLDSSLFSSLWRLLTEAEQHQCLQQSIQSFPQAEDWFPFLDLLPKSMTILPEKSALLIANTLWKLAERSSGNHAFVLRQQFNQLPNLMPFLPVSIYPRLSTLWAANPQWPNWYDEPFQFALSLLGERYQLHQAFVAEPN